MNQYFFYLFEFTAFILPAIPDIFIHRLTILLIYFIAHVFKLQYYYSKIKNKYRLEYND